MNKLILILLTSLVLVSCGNYDMNKEGISSGELKIGVDYSYSMLTDAEIFVYQSLYQKAKINPVYTNESDVIQALLDDSVQAAIISRPLNQEEMDFFKSKQRFPESTKIAVDGVALVVNPSSQDTVITMEQLEAIFKGEIDNWKTINPNSSNEKLMVVFDNNKSCNGRYIKEKFIPNSSFPPTCFAVNNNEEVIDYVANNPGAIGVISVSWISDRDEPKTLEFLKKVKPVGILDPSNTVDPQLPRRPFQAYIFDQTYPLRRDVYVVRTGLRGTLGTGFASFVAGEKGQLIIHKMGMVAATSPVRTIKITE